LLIAKILKERLSKNRDNSQVLLNLMMKVIVEDREMAIKAENNMKMLKTLS
jgi:hypothetical protein